MVIIDCSALGVVRVNLPSSELRAESEQFVGTNKISPVLCQRTRISGERVLAPDFRGGHAEFNFPILTGLTKDKAVGGGRHDVNVPEPLGSMNRRPRIQWNGTSSAERVQDVLIKTRLCSFSITNRAPVYRAARA